MYIMLVVDLSHVIYRSWYALYDKDVPTPCALWGLFKSLEKWQSSYKRIVFALDGGIQHRTSVLASYKSKEFTSFKRALTCQRALCEHVLASMGFECYYSPGWEADDVIATIVRRVDDVVDIVSADHDLYTLLSERVRLVWVNRFFTVRDFVEQYGIQASYWPEVKALVGDAGDCVPGVPQIGEKRAIKIVQEFGSAAGAIESNEPFPHVAKVRALREQVRIAHFLVSLYSVPLIRFESQLYWQPEWLPERRG